MKAAPRPFTLVLVEDDEGHARLIARNLQRMGVVNPLMRLNSGKEALAALMAPSSGPTARPPERVIVLDLNLPDIDGFEILHTLKTSPSTKHLPVVVLTTTDHPNDIERCYALGCDGFLTKPATAEDFALCLARLGLDLSLHDPSLRARTRLKPDI
jgi:CheY-like chemotaxis protein